MQKITDFLRKKKSLFQIIDKNKRQSFYSGIHLDSDVGERS